MDAEKASAAVDLWSGSPVEGSSPGVRANKLRMLERLLSPALVASVHWELADGASHGSVTMPKTVLAAQP